MIKSSLIFVIITIQIMFNCSLKRISKMEAKYNVL